MIEKALAINGWMTADELLWLATQAQKHKAIVEIGSYQGRSTRALGDHTNGFVFAIDDWGGPRDIDCDKYRLRDKFHGNLGDLILSSKVIPVILDHAMPPPVEIVPDMVFIDGDHKYESVRRDIETWRPRITKGGLIAGHDFKLPGVAKAVTELLPGYQVAPQTDIWFQEV